MSNRLLLLALGLVSLLPAGGFAAAGAYRLETVALPASVLPPEIFAVTFSPEGDLYIASRAGDIWRADRRARVWTRFASGLNEPLGLLVESSRVAYVMHRPELTRVEDTDGDGVADTFTTLANSWGITGNYHEFPYGLKRDREGNFVGSLGLDSGGEREFVNIRLTRGTVVKQPVREEMQWSLVPYRGWSFKVTPTGEFIPWSYGFRQPTGIGISPEGDFFTTDNQGDWVASSGLIHHKQGHFYGHPAAMKWLPGGPPAIESDEALARMRTPPAVILPHGALGGSPGEPAWDLSAGKFGPFAGQVFLGDYSKLISRVLLEKIDGEYQGAAFPFFRNEGLRQGNTRMAFSPDGVLYIGQTSWGVGEGLQRLSWTGEMPVEILAVRLLDRGFALEFTVPMEAAAAARPASFPLRRFRYLYHGKYGSPRIDETPVAIAEARISPDARRVELTVPDLKPGFIYEFQLESLRAADGRLLVNPSAFYTANRLRSGERFTGPFTRPLLEPAAAAQAQGINLAAGKATYTTYCVACHQEDGRGGGTGPVAAAANFVDDATRLAKSDAELLRSIRLGLDATGMPAFGAVLSDQEVRNVLAYVRESFDPARRRQR